MKWHEHPIAGVSMNPIKGSLFDYYGFCDLAVLVQRPGGHVETIVDCRTRVAVSPLLGNFTDAETVRFKIIGFSYATEAVPVLGTLKTICMGTRDCVPVAVNSRLCSKLLHRAVRLDEGQGHKFDKKGVFMLRERSRWIDLGLWRLNAGAERFSGTSITPKERVLEAIDRMPKLAIALGIDPSWTLSELLDWQEKLIPF